MRPGRGWSARSGTASRRACTGAGEAFLIIKDKTLIEPEPGHRRAGGVILR